MPGSYSMNAEDVRLAANPGLEVSGGGLRAKLASNKGLILDGNGVQIALDNTPNASLVVGVGGLKAKLDGAAGIAVGAGGIGMKLAANNGLGYDGGGNLQTVLKANEGLGKDASGLFVARADASLASTGGGLSVKLSTNKGLSLDGGNGIQVNAPGNGLQLDGTGTLQVVLDGSAGGRLSKSGTGLRVQTGGAGLPVLFLTDDHVANSFVYNGGLGVSEKNALETPSTHANITKMFELFKAGAAVMNNVPGVPANPGEWRLVGNVIQIFSDITAQNDVYRLKYAKDL